MGRGHAGKLSPLIILTLGVAAGCGRNATPESSTTNATSVKTIASLVPAVTDLVIGMGARDRLVAVSTFDRQRPDVDKLPKVGDYQTIDWEQLRQIRPSLIAIDIRPDRLPPGFAERAGEIEASTDNFTIDRLDHVYDALEKLGKDLDLVDQSLKAERDLQARLDAVRRRVGSEQPVRTLLIVGESGQSIVGPDTYLDDLLHVAGGVNAAAKLKSQWPQIDRETLLSLKPDVIIQLMPQASPQEREQAAQLWKQLPQIPAVAAGRVFTIDSWYALLPGWHVADVAERFAECLHPSTPSSLPSTTNPAGNPAP
jgi:ABC-type Fe3+-hydroxamate transport system substrate-binding protein